jgi:hypothetical protein
MERGDETSPERPGGRVARRGLPRRAPTDPDVQVSRIRLFETRLRYAGRACFGVSSG